MAALTVFNHVDALNKRQSPFSEELMNQIARSNDPDTSHEAAEILIASGAHGEMCKQALNLVIENPDKTANELETLGNYVNGQIRKRLNDLFHNNQVIKSGTRKCSVTGRRATTWRAS